MTTIAYHHDSQQIAVDGRLSAGDVLLTDKAIKWMVTDYGVWFFSGYLNEFNTLMKYYRKNKAEQQIETEAFLTYEDKVYNVYVHEGELVIDRVTWDDALGSGRRHALTAMDFGATAEEAVRGAAKRDLSTGGTVTVYDIKTKRFL